MKVRKKDGKLEDFNKNKVIKGCKKAGASSKLANEVVTVVSNEVYDGMPTTEIRAIVLRELERKDKKSAIEFRKFKR